jgi:HEAT repeat protein
MVKKEQSMAAIEALVQLGDQRLTPVILKALEEDHPAGRYDERMVLIVALEKLKDPQAAKTLERELTHPEWRIRRAAAHALAAIGKSSSKKPLTICKEDFYADVRRACTKAAQQVSSATR